jgi:nucleoside 2-deoxyribosyltransferase
MNATLVSGDVSAAHDDRPTVYLAAPFSHPDPAVRKVRFDAACQTAAALIRSGIHVFSPLSHSCAIALYGLPTAWSFWESFDRRMLAACDELVVLQLDGWRESRGVQAEIDLAIELDLPIRYLDPACIDEVLA